MPSQTLWTLGAKIPQAMSKKVKKILVLYTNFIWIVLSIVWLFTNKGETEPWVSFLALFYQR